MNAAPFALVCLADITRFQKKTNVSRRNSMKTRAGGHFFLLFPTFVLFPIKFFLYTLLSLPQGQVGVLRSNINEMKRQINRQVCFILKYVLKKLRDAS